MSADRVALAEIRREELARVGGAWLRAEGRSMAPSLAQGDRMRVVPVAPEEVAAGQVVTYQLEGGALCTHRVRRVQRNDSGLVLVTRGDNVGSDDPPVPAELLVGQVVARERFGVVTRFDKAAWRVRAPWLRAAGEVRAAVRNALRPAERRGPGRPRDVAADAIAQVARLDGRIDPATLELLAAEDAQSLRTLVRSHKLAPRFEGALDDSSEGWLRVLAQDEARAWRAACVTALNAAERALDVVADVSERAVVLKGPAFAQTLYGSECARPFTDLDIMVPRDEIAACVAALEGAGWKHRPRRRFRWERTRELHNLLPGGPGASLRVEVHPSLVDKPEFAPGLARDESAPWRHVTLTRVAGGDRLVLDAEAALLMACLHWHLHSYTGLTWGLDVALAAAGGSTPGATQPDWERTAALAREWEISHLCWVALTLTSLEHGAPVPPEVLHELRPRDPFAHLLVRRIAARHPVFRTERRLTVEQALVLALRDRLWRRTGALVLLPLRVLAWEPEAVEEPAPPDGPAPAGGPGPRGEPAP
jgi:signal peptidase I